MSKSFPFVLACILTSFTMAASASDLPWANGTVGQSPSFNTIILMKSGSTGDASSFSVTAGGSTISLGAMLSTIQGIRQGQSVTFRGAWSSATAYNVNDFVTYNGQTYIVTAPFTSGTTFTTVNLSLIAASGSSGPAGAPGSPGIPGIPGAQGQPGNVGAPGANGQGFTYRGSWVANRAYNPYDVLSFNGQTYEVVNAFTSTNVFDATNMVLWAASAIQSNGPTYAGVNPLSSNYTLVSSDAGRILNFSSSSNVSLTVPTPQSLGLNNGIVVDELQAGSGVIQFVPGSGASISNVSGNTRSGGQYATTRLIALSATSWILTGKTSP